MAYIFDDWKALLDNFQKSVEKDLEEIHQQKCEVQQIKVDIFNKLDKGLFYRDDQRIVISAPEIIIGNVDKSGALVGSEQGRVVVKGSEVALEGVGDRGRIVNRAPASSSWQSILASTAWSQWYAAPPRSSHRLATSPSTVVTPRMRSPHVRYQPAKVASVSMPTTV